MNEKSKEYWRKIYLMYGEEFDLMDIDIKLFKALTYNKIIVLPKDDPDNFDYLMEYTHKFKFTEKGLREIGYGIN